MFNRYFAASFFSLATIALAACSAPVTPPAPSRASPLEVFPTTDETLALECEKKFQPIRQAKLFPGGTWELTVSTEPGGDEIIYYQQADNEICAVRNREQSCAKWKREHGWSPCEKQRG